MIRRIVDLDRTTHLPFTTYTVREDADEVARANAADDPDGWRYKVVKRSAGYVVEVYDHTDTYQGVL